MNNPTPTSQYAKLKLFLIILVCASPMMLSYLFYYVIKPEGRTNYGTLIDPRAYPLPNITMKTEKGETVQLTQYVGKWMMVQAEKAGCPEVCQRKLWEMRQLRLTQGKDQERILRVWLVVDEKAIDPKLEAGIEGTLVLRVNKEDLKKWLPVDTKNDTDIEDHLYLVDPLGNLMMRYPKNADPNKIKKDLSKLLKASAIRQ